MLSAVTVAPSLYAKRSHSEVVAVIPATKAWLAVLNRPIAKAEASLEYHVNEASQ